MINIKSVEEKEHLIKMNKIQNQRDLIGKIIEYRNDFCKEGEIKKVAVVGIAYLDTSVMKVTTYPINISPSFYKLGIMRSQQKQNERDFKVAGDWCFVINRAEIKTLSEKERRILQEKINQ